MSTTLLKEIVAQWNIFFSSTRLNIIPKYLKSCVTFPEKPDGLPVFAHTANDDFEVTKTE
jgi:hypothetical protein